MNISLSSESGSEYESSEESSSNEDISEENLKEFLYENSNITLKDFSLSLLVLKYKHKLSEAVMNDFLNFIKIIIL